MGRNAGGGCNFQKIEEFSKKLGFPGRMLKMGFLGDLGDKKGRRVLGEMREKGVLDVWSCSEDR